MTEKHKPIESGQRSCSIVSCRNSWLHLHKWNAQFCDQHKVKKGTGRCDCDPPFRLFPFPTNSQPVKRAQWIKNIKRQLGEGNLLVPNEQRVCSKHFVTGEPTPENPYPVLHMGLITRKRTYNATATQDTIQKSEKETKAQQNRPGSKLNMSGSEPNMSGSEPNMSGSEPNMSGSEPNMSGSEPNMSGNEPNKSGSKLNMSGSEPNMSGSEPNMSGSEPNKSGSKLNMSGSEPNMSGSEPNMSGSEPNMSGSEPNVSGSELNRVEADDSCIRCGLGFTHLSLLTNHLTRVHSPVVMHKCLQCDEIFVRSWLLEDHMNIHSGKAPYDCSECGLTFAQRRTMSFHKKQNHTLTNEEYFCGDCGKVYKSVSSLKTHMFMQHRKSRLFWCEQCGIDFKYKSDLKVHISRMHKDNALFVCGQCDKSFTALTTLKHHELTHCVVQTHKRLHQNCNCENASHLTVNQLKTCEEHQKLHGQCSPQKNCKKHKDQPFKCEVCESRFRHFYEVKMHTLSTHTDLKPFKCGECGKCFPSQEKLNLHIKMHMTVKCNSSVEKEVNIGKYNEENNDHLKHKDWRYTCEICKCTFRNHYQIKMHTLQTHKDLKPFKCSECGKCFVSQEKVNLHMKTHMAMTHRNVIPFKCSECEKCFASLVKLNLHMKTHGTVKISIISVRKHNLGGENDEELKDIIYKNDTEIQVKVGEKKTKPDNCLHNEVEQAKYSGEIQDLEKDTENFGNDTEKAIQKSDSLNEQINSGIDSNIILLKCLRCDKCFDSMTELSVHNVIHQEDFAFRCIKCGQRFSHLSLLTNHFNEAHGQVFHNCLQCGQQFVKSWSLQDHMNIHLNKAPYKCPECGLSFAERKNMTVHKYQNHKLTNEEYFCGDCGGVYESVGSLQTHMLKQHRKESPFWCHKCSVHFKYHFELGLHIFHMHTDTTPFVCGQCRQSFTELSTLKQHKLTHSITMPFKCSHTGCNQAFLSQGELNKHRKIHPRVQTVKSSHSEAYGLIEYPCLYCKERFVTFSEAQTHIKSHGELKLDPILETQKKVCDLEMMVGVKEDFHGIQDDENSTDCDDTKLCPCLACHTCFTSNSDLEAHLKTHIHVNI